MSIRKFLDSTAIIVYAKASGLLRDMMIVFMFGLSEISDAVFFCMTFIMLFQLASYQGSVNVLGNHATLFKLYKWISNNKYVISISCFGGAALASILFSLLINSGYTLLNSYLICFLILVPFSIAIGIIASFKMLEGDRNYHVVAVSIQNTVVLIFSTIFYLKFSHQYIFLVWFLGCASVFLYLKPSVILNVETSKDFTDSISTLTYSFLSPVVMFSIVLTERWFYSGVEGSVGLIKFLETGAMAVIFLMEVVFLNPVLARIAQDKDWMAIDKRRALMSAFKKVFPLGSVLMAGFIAVITVSEQYSLLPFDVSKEVSQFFVVLSVLYFVYFVTAMIRDYVERYYFLQGRPSLVFKANVIILMLTIVTNFLLLDMAPLSIAIVAIALMTAKDIFLIVNAYNTKAMDSE